jgi:hypothetical protein
MSVNLNSGVAETGGSTFDAGGSMLMLRCACGATVDAESESELIRLARLHFGEFHPDLSGDVSAAAILAMAEQKGRP